MIGILIPVRSNVVDLAANMRLHTTEYRRWWRDTPEAKGGFAKARQ